MYIYVYISKYSNIIDNNLINIEFDDRQIIIIEWIFQLKKNDLTIL